jgi:hypothetical protein
MRGKWAVAVAVGTALLAGGCNPATDRRYVNEGAGVDLYAPDGPAQAALLDDYVGYLCHQVGPSCAPASMTFVIAGMNDIDQRCDGYLTWLDARRRDREPVLAELGAIGAAIHSIMTVTGSSPTSLNILSAAFGLAIASYSNWNSRLLISVEQSTVQAVVYKSQGDYRTKIKDWNVSDRPTAIYLLRNYLRLCLPTTIEATFNTSTILVQTSPAAAAAAATKGSLVVANVTQPRVQRLTFVAPTSSEAQRIQAFFDSGPQNKSTVRAWLTKNNIFTGFGGFIASGDRAAFLRLIQELNIP